MEEEADLLVLDIRNHRAIAAGQTSFVECVSPPARSALSEQYACIVDAGKGEIYDLCCGLVPEGPPELHKIVVDDRLVYPVIGTQLPDLAKHFL